MGGGRCVEGWEVPINETGSNVFCCFCFLMSFFRLLGFIVYRFLGLVSSLIDYCFFGSWFQSFLFSEFQRFKNQVMFFDRY